MTKFYFVRRGSKFATVPHAHPSAQPLSPFPLLAAAMAVTHRVFTQVLLPFLILGLPTMGATLGGRAIDVGENHRVMEGSGGGFLAFLSNAKSSISMFGSYESSPTAL